MRRDTSGDPMITPAETKKLAQDMWLWLAVNPGKRKNQWPRFSEIKDMFAHDPFCDRENKLDAQEPEGVLRHCTYCWLCSSNGEGCANGWVQRWEDSLDKDDGNATQTAAENVLALIDAWDTTQEDDA